MTLSETDNASSQAVQDMFVREQFLNTCPRDLAANVREKVVRDLE